MSDYQTLHHNIVEECALDSTSVPQEVSDKVGRAICESIRFNRHHQYFFNVRRYSLSTFANQYSYPLPKDFLSLAGDLYFTSSGQDGTSRHPLISSTVDAIEGLKYVGNDYGSHFNSGSPMFYAIDITDKKLLFSSVPSENDGVVDFRYVADLGTPSFIWDGTNWTIRSPNSETAIAATYSNSWFREGYYITKARAIYHLWSREFGGTETSMAKAQAALMSWQEEKNKLQGETSILQMTQLVRKHI